MYQYILFATVIGLGQCRPTLVDSGSGGFGGASGVDWQSAQLSALSLGGGGGGDEWAGAASNYGFNSGHGDLGQGQGYIGGDFHHGVSVVGTGGGGKGAVFDLTSQAGPGHQGAFGGSFVASSKYSAAGAGGGGGGHGWAGGYGVSEGGSGGLGENYSEVLGASESIGGGGYEALSAGSFGGGEGLGGHH